MNNQLQVEVQYVNPRKDRRPPSIKTSDGNYFNIPDAALGVFAQGMSGVIGFDINAKGYKQATHWNGQPLPQGFTPQPVMQPAQNFQQAGANVYQQDTNRPSQADNKADTKSEDMFVMGVVGRAMGSGQFIVNDVELLTKAAVRAWQNRHKMEPAFDDGAPWPDPDDYGQ
jgi:hypothetical protein